MVTTFHAPTRVEFGPGSFGRIGQYSAGLGLRRVLLVTNSGTSQLVDLQDHVRRRLELVGIGVVATSPVPPLPSTHTVTQVASRLRAIEADGIVVVGGGRVIDVAKLAALVAAGGGTPEDYELPHAPLVGRRFPVLAMPTSSGSGAEVSPFAFVRGPDGARPVVAHTADLAPDVAIVDPELTRTLPPTHTLAGGVLALAGLVEPCVVTEPNPFVAPWSERALLLLRDQLPRALSDPFEGEARAAVAEAGVLAGLVAAQTDLGSCLAVALALWTSVRGPAEPPPLGFLCGAVLPKLLEAHCRARPGCVQNFAARLTHMRPSDDSEAVLAISAWLQGFGIPASLRDLEFTAGRHEAILALILDHPRLARAAAVLGEAELRTILRALLEDA